MKYGFIGCGNMGGAVARAVCKGAGSGDVLLANRTPAKAQALADELGCACGTNEEVAGICDFIFLGVKPQMMADMLDELTPTLEARAESRPLCWSRWRRACRCSRSARWRAAAIPSSV